jgi:hypothetical protein
LARNTHGFDFDDSKKAGLELLVKTKLQGCHGANPFVC